MKMKRCPKPNCGCGAEFTNQLEFKLKEAAALAAAAAAGFVLNPFTHKGSVQGRLIFENMMSNVRKHYKCTNPICGYEWDEDWNQ